MPDKLKSLFTSRRFWGAVAGIVAIVTHETLGISEDDVLKIAAIVIAWIVGDTFRRTA